MRRLRLAAQRLTPATAAADPGAAARAVVGVQAQDVRAAGLALRSRVPGLRRAGVDGSGLIRTWAARGTVHLIDPADWPWLYAALGARNRARFDAAMRQRGDYDAATGMLDDLVAVLRERPLDRAGLLGELAARGHPGLGQRSVNVLMPWAAAQGLVAGLPDGRYRAAEPPPAVDAELALATLARRYLAGYGRPQRPTWRPGPASRSAPPAGRWPPRGPPRAPASCSRCPAPWTWPRRPRRPPCCSPRSTPPCWATAAANRWSPPRTTAASCRAAACCARPS